MENNGKKRKNTENIGKKWKITDKVGKQKHFLSLGIITKKK